MKTDVVVMGAGAIGLATAYELARRGKAVVVVDRDALPEPAAGSSDAPYRSASSWAAAGILPPANLDAATDPIERLRGFSHGLFPELTARLKAETGIDPLFARCGGWYLSDTAGETASMVGMVSFWRDLNIECGELELSDLVRREPALKPWTDAQPNARAWWVPDECQISPPLFLQALYRACRMLGVTFMDRSCVVDVSDVDGGVTIAVDVRNRGQRTIHADQAVVCGGVWSGRIADRLMLSNSLVPVRGQMLLLKTEALIITSIINFGQRYLVPRRDGAVLVGSCEEEVGFQHGTTPPVLAQLRQFAREVCPAMKSAREIGAWSGLRPLTFDGFPMIGKLPDSGSIYVATGHFRSGIHLSPGTATCLADMMLGTRPAVEIDAFGVGKQQGHPQ